nr:methyltransferase [Desulfitobacterium hafniense]
ATCDLVGPYAYRDYLLPIHKIINERIDGPTILHICGNTLDRMGYIAGAGFKNFHFDSKVKANDAVAAVRGKISLSGNINNVETLLTGTVQKVAKEVIDALKDGVQIIGPECAVPLRVRNSNLRAIVDTILNNDYLN